MIHPATLRAVRQLLSALDVPVDIGIVHPGTETGAGRAWWQKQPLRVKDVITLLPRLARENATGAAIYVRPWQMGSDDASPHCGIVLVDDLPAAAISTMMADGLAAIAVIETSPGNHQTRTRLPTERLTNAITRAAARRLAERYHGDPKAVAASQPGRLPGFTNRKPRHRTADGSFPFCRLVSTAAPVVTDAMLNLMAEFMHVTPPASAQPRRAAGAAETPAATLMAAPLLDPTQDADAGELARLHDWARGRIKAQIRAGTRPLAAGTESEIDFAFAFKALATGVDKQLVESWLSQWRPEKPPA